MSSNSPQSETVAVVGSGAAGLTSAWLLSRGGYNVHLYESEHRPGGHANTMDIPIPGSNPVATIPVDTGFIVYNTQTYPDLVSLFQLLAIEEENSSMSFSSSTHLPSGHLLEWGSDSLTTLFANRSNLYRPAMYTMLYDMNRFNNAVHEFVNAEKNPSFIDRHMTLAQFLDRGAYSAVFIQSYLVPMVSAVWSASFDSAMHFPARSLFHFFVNHGLAQIFARPQWRTPAKRSRDYVTTLLADFRAHRGTLHLSSKVTRVTRHHDSVTVYAATCEPVRFDHVIFATHAPTTLRILGDSATDDERRLLSTFQYSTNKAYVHHDSRLMPKNHTVWSSWNFISPRAPDPLHQNAPIRVPEQLTTCTSDSQQSQGQPFDAHYSTSSNDTAPIDVPVSNPTTETNTTDATNSHSTESNDHQTPLQERRHRQQIVNSESQPSTSSSNDASDSIPACVSYWLNRLQNYHKYHLPVPDLFLTLNPVISINPDKILAEVSYDHPQFTEAAVCAQSEIQSTIQGKNRTWFCGSYTRYGFHEDAMMSGLDVAERLSDFTVLRPWKAKNCLAINNNSLSYEIPYSPMRAPMLAFLAALLVLNAVISRLQAGLGKIAARMSDRDPVVLVASGDGRLHRFGPRHVRRRTSSFFTFSRLQETPVLDEPQTTGARITVRNPRVLARITDALRHGFELAPIAAAAFAAGELDCPSPTDLSETLRALFITDGLDDPSKARKSRAKLAENLLSAVVGKFEEVKSIPSHTRLPELTTCMSSVLSPSWWLEFEQADDDMNDENNDFKPLSSKVSPFDLSKASHVLELIGDLSEITVSLLQNNSTCRATIIVQSQERRDFVSRKADLLSVEGQVTVTLLEHFKKQRSTGFGASSDMDKNETRYDVIFSPGLANNFDCYGFKSVGDAMVLLHSVAAPNAVIEIGAVVYGNGRKKNLHGKANRTCSLFSGDDGYHLWETTDLLSAAEFPAFDLQHVIFMNNEEAAMDVYEVIQRVYNSLATDKLEATETRSVLAQMCLWQAALDVKYLRRIAMSFTMS